MDVPLGLFFGRLIQLLLGIKLFKQFKEPVAFHVSCLARFSLNTCTGRVKNSHNLRLAQGSNYLINILSVFKLLLVSLDLKLMEYISFK